MQVIVSGKHLDVGTSLQAHAEEALKSRVKRYFDRAVTSHVTISKQGAFFLTDIVVNEGSGNGALIKGNSSETDPYHSVDSAIAKIEKQLRRYKNKLRDHNHVAHKESLAHLEFKKYVMAPIAGDLSVEQASEPSPVIIAEKVTRIDTLSVGDAVMKMDLLNLPALLFINSGNKKLSMVHYRDDGNIAWVDTSISAT